MPIAGVEEQLRGVDRLDQFTRCGKVFHRPSSFSIMWICSGTPCGHEPPNSQGDTVISGAIDPYPYLNQVC